MRRNAVIVWIVPIIVIGILVGAASTLEPDRDLVAQNSGDETDEGDGEEDAEENGEENGEDDGKENGDIESISEFSGEDGTYEGTAEGFHDDVTLSVTVEGGEVVAIDAVSHDERDDLWDDVWSTIPDAIISEQSTDVDTVSGATWTSEAVFDAVLAALSSQ
ncbi:MAG: FMN-binding protein [Spirochaetales bacterium]